MAGEVAAQRAKALRDFQHDELKKHGATLRKALIRSANEATGGDRRFSGLGNEPRLGVTLRTTRGRNSTTVVITPSPKRARGPWVWIQYGTRAGIRGRKGIARQRKVGRSYVTQQRIPYFHPGTQATQAADAWFGPVETEMKKIRPAIRRNFNAVSR